MEAQELKRLKELEEENGRLNKRFGFVNNTTLTAATGETSPLPTRVILLSNSLQDLLTPL